jgi:DUF177 domain-containing protein
VGRASDADAGAFAEPDKASALGGGSARTGDLAEPEWAWGAEIGSVEGSVDAEGGGEAARTAGEVEQAGGLAVILHLFDAFKRFERTDEDATADSRDFCAHVEHEVVAVTEINVGVAAAQKHGAIARGWTAKVVRGGITSRVTFGLNDAPAETDAGEFADDDLADQEARQGDGIRGQFGAAKAADSNGNFAGLGGWQARQSSGAVRKSNLTPDQVFPPALHRTDSKRKPMEPAKRQHVRTRMDQLLYAEFGPENGSILLNLSEEGCSFQSIAPVRTEHVRFSVSVGDGRKLEGDGQMVWSDAARKTGGVRWKRPRSGEVRKRRRNWASWGNQGARNPQETALQAENSRFLDLAGERLNNEEGMKARAGGAEDMFLDVKDLAVRKLPIRKSYAPGSIDYQTAEIKQMEPLEVNATAELLDGQIRIAGDIETKVELVCARCLEPVVEEVSRTFDLFYSPLPKGVKPEEARLKEDDAEIGFFEGEGLFLADVLREQVLLALPMKAICRGDCRGLCPNCGANLNHEECRCETHATDPRLAPLARLKQDWLKKQ